MSLPAELHEESAVAAVCGRRIVITGGSGFLGVSLATHLTSLGAEVVIVSRSRPVAGAWQYCSWDGRTLGDWQRVLEGAFGVVNLAGRSCSRWGRRRSRWRHTRCRPVLLIEQRAFRLHRDRLEHWNRCRWFVVNPGPPGIVPPNRNVNRLFAPADRETFSTGQHCNGNHHFLRCHAPVIAIFPHSIPQPFAPRGHETVAGSQHPGSGNHQLILRRISDSRPPSLASSQFVPESSAF